MEEEDVISISEYINFENTVIKRLTEIKNVADVEDINQLLSICIQERGIISIKFDYNIKNVKLEIIVSIVSTEEFDVAIMLGYKAESEVIYKKFLHDNDKQDIVMNMSTSFIYQLSTLFNDREIKAACNNFVIYMQDIEAQ